MIRKYKSFEDIDFETLLDLLQNDELINQVDLKTKTYIYTIRNTFAQCLDSIKDDTYNITFEQLCYIVLINMQLNGSELYDKINLVYHKDYDDVIEKPRTGISLLARLTHFNKYCVDMFNEFSKSIAKYRLPETTKILKNTESNFIEDVIYIACKGDASKLPVVYKMQASDVLMFIEQEARRTAEIKRMQKL